MERVTRAPRYPRATESGWFELDQTTALLEGGDGVIGTRDRTFGSVTGILRLVAVARDDVRKLVRARPGDHVGRVNVSLRLFSRQEVLSPQHLRCAW